VREDEWDTLVGADAELADGLEIFPEEHAIERQSPGLRSQSSSASADMKSPRGDAPVLPPVGTPPAL